jgi:tripartite-type tricarboxylate transporter receptor subunit TctC
MVFGRLGASGILLSGAVMAASSALLAADYPERPVKALVGFAAGGGADQLARHYADKLAQLSKGTFVVENKVGVSGNLAVYVTAKSPADGYTLIFNSTASAAVPYVYKDLNFDLQKDVVPIASYGETPFVLVVAPDSPAKNVAELTELLKAKKGKATYGWSSTLALASAVIYTSAAGVEASAVGHKVMANMVSDISAGQLDFGFADTMFAIGQARQGRVKILAITSQGRSEILPDVPSMTELGYQTGGITPLWGLWAPAGTPAPIVEKLGAWMSEISAMPSTREFLKSLGINIVVTDMAGYKAKVDAALKGWGQVTSMAKIEPQ